MASNHLTARKYPPTKPATTITDRPTVHCYCGQRMTRRGCRCVIVMRLCKRLRRTRCITYITHFRHTSARKHAGLQERLHYDVVVFSFLFGRLKMMLHAHAPRCRDHSHTHTHTRGRADVRTQSVCCPALRALYEARRRRRRRRDTTAHALRVLQLRW